MAGFFDLSTAGSIPLPQYQQAGFGTPSVPNLWNYSPTDFGGAEQGALGGIGNLGGMNQYAAGLPQAQAITNWMTSDPSSAQAQRGARVGGQMGQQAAQNQFGAGGSLYGLGGAIANTAFDPQSALYNRTQQQLTDQTRASEAARGIGSTPFGAGLENDAMRNFNIDWQNQQLQRQIQGGQAAGGLFGQGANMQAAAPGQYAAASAMPWQTNQMIGNAQMGALGQLGQFGQLGAQQQQGQNQQYMDYLRWATGQQGAANNAQQGNFGMNQNVFADQMQLLQNQQQQQQQQFQDQMAQDKQAFGQNQAIWGGIGNLAGSAMGGPIGGAVGSSLFGGGGGGQTGMFGPTSGNYAAPYYASQYGTPSQLFPGYGG